MKRARELQIQIPDKTPGASITVPEHLPKLPTICIATGQAGKGKTTATFNLLKFYRENNLCDRVFLVSPTTQSNASFVEEFQLPIHEQDTFKPNEKGIVQKIMDEVERERDDYVRYLEDKKRYERMRKMLQEYPQSTFMNQSGSYENNVISYTQGKIDLQPPRHKYGGKKPVLWVLFDDCQGTPVFKASSQISYMAIKHRHLGAFDDGGALGISMVANIQNFRDRNDGIPRPIRSNARQIMIYFTKDEKEREAIGEEAAGVCDKEVLWDRLDKATAPFQPDFLLVDKNPQRPEYVFRKNFDTIMEPPPEVTGKAEKVQKTAKQEKVKQATANR